jgi:hypothetical protein
MDADAAAAGVASAVAAWHELLLPVEDAVLAATGAPGASVQDLDDALELALIPLLADGGSGIVGGGFAAARPLPASGLRHRAWWRSEQGGVRRVVVFDDEEDERFHDVSREEWWSSAVTGSRPRLAGPYGPPGASELVLAHPIADDEGPLGVVALEIALPAFERSVMPALLAVGADAGLVDPAGRPFVAADPAHPLLVAAGRELDWGGGGVHLVAGAS